MFGTTAPILHEGFAIVVQLVPPPVRDPQYYSIMGVRPNATPEQIKKAYKLRSLESHPDKKGGCASQFRFYKEVSSILLSADRRAVYDEFGMVPRIGPTTCVYAGLDEFERLYGTVIKYLIQVFDIQVPFMPCFVGCVSGMYRERTCYACQGTGNANRYMVCQAYAEFAGKVSQKGESWRRHRVTIVRGIWLRNVWVSECNCRGQSLSAISCSKQKEREEEREEAPQEGRPGHGRTTALDQ
jgi:DnaJ domain